VDHQEVDPRQLEPFEALVDRTLEVARREPIEPDLCGEEDVLALEPRGAHAFADLALIAVHLCGIEMAITEMQRRLDQFDAEIFLERQGAEAGDGNARAVTFDDLHAEFLALLPGLLALAYSIDD